MYNLCNVDGSGMFIDWIAKIWISCRLHIIQFIFGSLKLLAHDEVDFNEVDGEISVGWISLLLRTCEA